jgi:dTDP-4-dehydrorhamnose reductase
VKALVLGASGFLGSYAGFALNAAGWTVTGASRKPLEWYPSVALIEKLDDVPSLIRGGNWDVIINCVALANHEACEEKPEEARLLNVELPALWAAVAGESSARFVHFSTDAVFDGKSNEPYGEGDFASPPSVYGRTKLQGEQAVLAANSQALVFRTNFFGWSQSGEKGILDFFARGIETGTAMTGFSDYIVSSLYTGDLFDLLVEAVRKEAAGLFHLTSSTPLSKYDFGIVVAQALEGDVSLVQQGLLAEQSMLGNRGHNLGLSVTKLHELLGHSIPSTIQGIARALAERQAVMDYFGGMGKGQK